MLDEFSNINDAFKFFRDDPELKEFGEIINEATFILSKLNEDFRPFAFEHEMGDIPDYRHYLIIFIDRTWRIFQSILLLILHGRFCEAMMLERPFIENIVNTKIFLQRRSRARTLRKIRLYEIINDDLYCEFLKKDLDEDIESEGFTFSSNIGVLKDMKEEVNKDKKKYHAQEIDKMKTAILEGKRNSWHGEKTKNALDIANMRQHSQTYDLACMLLHVREPNPYFCEERNNVVDKPFMLNGIIMTLFDHSSDYEIICKNTFIALNLSSKIVSNKNKLFKLFMKQMKRWHETHPNYKIIKFGKEET